MSLEIGNPAPAFTLETADGPVSLSDFAGRKLVLYFYPKDDTSGCTTEALKALVEYWFKNTDSNWLACSHAVENPASGKVMMKAGFVYDHEAVYHKFDGTAIPCKCYALTREHYESLYFPNE